MTPGWGGWAVGVWLCILASRACYRDANDTRWHGNPAPTLSWLVFAAGAIVCGVMATL